MENALNLLMRENPSALTSPTSNGTASQSSGSSAPPTPRSEPNLNPNPYPTTFVQADSSSFKQVVQMLTGSSETVKQASTRPAMEPNSRSFAPPIRKQSFKLYERRNNLKKGLIINPSNSRVSQNLSPFSPGFSPRNLSPSILDFPNLSLISPVTPLIEDPFIRSSPMSRESEPQLLQLFPLSPSVSRSSS